jgi:FtsP/CotA-like multicopper oxidase with cupredoxin domain
MHMHGIFFRVLERNGKTAPEHKGLWATHCHILEQAEAGLLTSIGIDTHEPESVDTAP